MTHICQQLGDAPSAHLGRKAPSLPFGAKPRSNSLTLSPLAQVCQQEEVSMLPTHLRHACSCDVPRSFGSYLAPSMVGFSIANWPHIRRAGELLQLGASLVSLPCRAPCGFPLGRLG